jgi:hypothetical protein
MRPWPTLAAAALASQLVASDPLTGQTPRDSVRSAVAPAAQPAARPELTGPGTRGMVVRAAGPHYTAGSLRRWLFGSGWRELWTTPLQVPVLDLAGFAGGLVPERQGGGNQSITLHMTDAAGDGWLFRSIDKFPGPAVSPDVEDTPVGDMIQDHVNMLNPGAHFVLPPILDALDILHPSPMPVLMPDDEALGEFRDVFAGMLGVIERRPDERDDDEPGFAGSRKIKNSENFLDDIEASAEHRLDEREFLRARLVDFLVGDPDRGTDQWRWARFGEDGDYSWRPIPRDRDWAFVRADGLLARIAASVYPKLIRFETDYPSMSTLTFSSHVLDRRLLTRLTRQDFADEAAAVVSTLTDAVIAQAVAALPPEYAATHAAMLAALLRARRDELPAVADAYYTSIAGEVDVRATDEANHAHIERRPDGSVRVLITAPSRPVHYDRVFVPTETHEVRVFMHGGADTVRVVGTRDGPIRLRVIGGGGDDVLIDEAGHVRFYDDRGENVVVRSVGTRFDGRSWREREADEGLRLDTGWTPDWGSATGIAPAVGYEEVTGVMLGVRGSVTRYGFRRAPHRWRLDVRGLAAPAIGALGADLTLSFQPADPLQQYVLRAEASGLHAFHFHGFGNQTTPAAADAVLFRQRTVRVEPRVEWLLPALAGTFSVGPVFSWTRTRMPAAALPAGTDGAPIGTADPATSYVTLAGGRAGLVVQRTDQPHLPRRGFRATLEAAGYPLAGDDTGQLGRVAGPFGRVAGTAAAYVPLLPGGRPHLAARVGVERVFGEFPAFEAAFVGGRHSLRGYERGRFAGDAGVHGALELRVPVDSVRLLVRTEVGLFGFTDAGRVWYDGASPGGWHTGWGGGIWLSSFGRAISVAVARGSGTRVHAWYGVPF